MSFIENDDAEMWQVLTDARTTNSMIRASDIPRPGLNFDLFCLSFTLVGALALVA
jgi:hypothetical protein